MSLKIRFRFDGKCRAHPRYNPETDGQPQHTSCPGCESLRVIFLYTRIAKRKADTGEGLVVSGPQERLSIQAGVSLEDAQHDDPAESMTPPHAAGDEPDSDEP